MAIGAFRLSLRVADAGASSPVAAAQLAELASQTTAAIHERGWDKPDSTYLVVWYDPLYGGAQGIGLLDELERSGLRAFASAEYGPLVTTHRLGALQNVTTLVILTGGDWIRDASVVGKATPVAYSDPRDVSTREEFEADRAALSAALKQLGRADLAAKLGERLSEAALVKGLHPNLRMTLSRMVDIGVPAAVFVSPLPPRKRTRAVRARQSSDGH
jgi:hypothetical protein